jgi:hypothetical protein
MNTSSNETTWNNPRTFMLLGMVLLAALTRLLPHPPNFAPITAMALFGGAMFGLSVRAFVLPLVAMLISDSLLEITTGWGFHEGMPFVYGAFIIAVVLGSLLHRRTSLLGVAGTTVAGSLLFFFVTNIGVWLTSGFYPATFEGLTACFTAAIPFYRNALLGDAVYATILFGGFALAQSRLQFLQPASTK